MIQRQDRNVKNVKYSIVRTQFLKERYIMLYIFDCPIIVLYYINVNDNNKLGIINNNTVGCV